MKATYNDKSKYLHNDPKAAHQNTVVQQLYCLEHDLTPITIHIVHEEHEGRQKNPNYRGVMHAIQTNLRHHAATKSSRQRKHLVRLRREAGCHV